MTKTSRQLRRVLLVDDSDIARGAFRRHLTMAGHVVVDCPSADEVIWLHGDFDIAVLDIDLGPSTVNGIQLAIDLLARDKVRDVIFISATTERALLAAARRLGRVVDKNATNAPTRLLQAIANAIDPDLTLPNS